MACALDDINLIQVMMHQCHV